MNRKPPFQFQLHAILTLYIISTLLGECIEQVIVDAAESVNGLAASVGASDQATLGGGHRHHVLLSRREASASHNAVNHSNDLPVTLSTVSGRIIAAHSAIPLHRFQQVRWSRAQHHRPDDGGDEGRDGGEFGERDDMELMGVSGGANLLGSSMEDDVCHREEEAEEGYSRIQRVHLARECCTREADSQHRTTRDTASHHLRWSLY